MSDPWYLGNDIVDLSDPRHLGKAEDQRFLERVFDAKERHRIGAAAEPDLAIWTRWAGKESAFKTVSKSRGTPPVFVHADYQVRLPREFETTPRQQGRNHLPQTLFGEVRCWDLTLPLRLEMSDGAIHALTWLPRRSGEVPPFTWGFQDLPESGGQWKETLRPRFSDAEWECISHRASAFARLAARQSVADRLGVEETSLEISCGPGRPGRRIPIVFLGGNPLDVDLTLSHHGHLLGWAFKTPEGIS
jgi:phosphopantetheinyl transferase (holo-ACP synthase)